MGVTYHCGDRFAFGVFSVGYSISDDIFKENFQHAACLFVNETGNSLNSATACQTSDCGFGNALDVVAQHFPVTFGSSFSQTFASFSTASHFSEDKSTTIRWQIKDYLCRSRRLADDWRQTMNFDPFLYGPYGVAVINSNFRINSNYSCNIRVWKGKSIKFWKLITVVPVNK